jgi:transcriptional regulator with XRE-family HTH domain
MIKSFKDIQNEANIKALRKARRFVKLTRPELASQLNVTAKAIEKYENGRDYLSQARIENILSAMNLTKQQFDKIKRGKSPNSIKDRTKNVLENVDRRSYQKNITQDCKILRSMRRSKSISQYKASELCNYSRATIGHIENGRIELTSERIRYIVTCYGYQYTDYEANINKRELRDSIVDSCIEKIKRLDDSKLEVFKNLLGTL